MKTPFIIIPELVAIAVAYRQGNLIADQVLPYVSVGSEEFRYKRFGLGDAFTAPETLVGRKGTPNQVDWSEQETPAFTQDHALDAPVPNKDYEAWERARARGLTGATDPMMRATRQVMELVMMRREKRAADLVFNAASYATGNKVAMASGSRFSDDAIKPQNIIGDALDTMIMRPNIAVFGRQAWTKTSRNPNLVKAAYGLGTEQGQVTKRLFAEMFELDDVLVGDGWINTAAKGQTPSVIRLWGKHCAFLHRNMNADTEFGITFGFTARYGDRVGGVIEDPDMGMRGGKRVRAGEAVRELVTAGDLGYFFENCVD
jgi:hypothetical protein